MDEQKQASNHSVAEKLWLPVNTQEYLSTCLLFSCILQEGGYSCAVPSLYFLVSNMVLKSFTIFVHETTLSS